MQDGEQNDVFMDEKKLLNKWRKIFFGSTEEESPRDRKYIYFGSIEKESLGDKKVNILNQ